MKKKINKLSIVIPVYNEKNNLLPLTKKLIFSLKTFKYEIIIVDDNSNDGSQKILSNLKKKYSFFKPLIRKKIPDLTKSCLLGINKSKFDNILIMDGDLQHDPKYIEPMFEKFDRNNLDIVVGSRDFNQKNMGLSLLRKLASIILIKLFSVFNLKVSDPMSGFFIFKKKIYLKNKNNLYRKGFKILIDILINSKNKLKISEIKIKFNLRRKNKSKMNFKVLYYIIELYCRSLLRLIFK
jgi:dolichol-phosphate mannosyltransferase